MSLAKVMGSGYGFKVIDAAIGTQRGQCFVFRPAVFRIDGVRLFHLHDLFTPDGTSRTSPHADANALYGLGRDFVCPLESSITPVAGRHVPGFQ
jgi:hypothetical protein